MVIHRRASVKKRTNPAASVLIGTLRSSFFILHSAFPILPMPFDPTKPADGSLIAAAELRNQLTGLHGV